MDIDFVQGFLDESGYTEWEVVDDCTLTTPNGHVIEWDGVSPDGEISPLRELGMI